MKDSDRQTNVSVAIRGATRRYIVSSDQTAITPTIAVQLWKATWVDAV